MTTLTIKIALDNAAFHDEDEPNPGPEVGRLLRKIASAVDDLPPEMLDAIDGGDATPWGLTLVDLNGSKVGLATVGAST